MKKIVLRISAGLMGLTDLSFRDHAEAKRAFFKSDKPNFQDKLETNAPRTYPWWTELNVETKPKPAHLPSSKL